MPWISRRFLLLGFLAAAGCRGSRSGNEAAATDDDRDRLREALEAWKDRRLAALGERTPPIRLVDDDEQAGLVLLDFEILPPPPGLEPPEIGVRLRLRDPKSRTVVRHASYRVETTHEVVITRGDS